jgi:hypothetical protein
MEYKPTIGDDRGDSVGGPYDINLPLETVAATRLGGQSERCQAADVDISPAWSSPATSCLERVEVSALRLWLNGTEMNLELAGQHPHMRFFEQTVVQPRDHAYGDAAQRKFTPATLPIIRAIQGMTARAQ